MIPRILLPSRSLLHQRNSFELLHWRQRVSTLGSSETTLQRLALTHAPPNPTYTRFFGSKPGSSSSGGDISGDIYFENNQTALMLNADRLRQTLTNIRKLIGYDTYDVSLILVDDEEMKEVNLETRGIDAPTDILSFPFHPAIRPGLLVKPEFEIADYYNLGDMIVDVPYVMECCRLDQKNYMEGDDPAGSVEEAGKDTVENEATNQTEDDSSSNDDDEEDDYVEDERGVSGAMATVFDPEERINMLLVHGMLHLVGHDHETDKDYECMVAEEERILAALGMIPPPEQSTHQT